MPSKRCIPANLGGSSSREIDRYYDFDLDGRIDDVAGEVESELDEVNAKIRKRHAKAIAALKAEQKKLTAAVKAFEKKAAPILENIREDLNAEAPDVDDYDWPEPDEGDEDDDPLFDSTREYVEQVDRYKEHQGKRTERKSYDTFQATCIVCNKPFEATKRKKVNTCSKNCKAKLQRGLASSSATCVVCGKSFKATKLNTTSTCSFECRAKQRPRISVTCVVCGEQFEGNKTSKTCSNKCRSQLSRDRLAGR